MIWLRVMLTSLGNPPTWSDICYTAALRRDHHDCRLAVLARTLGEGAGVAPGLSRRIPAKCFRRPQTVRARPEGGFLYEGAQAWDFHGGCLTLKLPGFAAILNDIDGSQSRWGLAPWIDPDEEQAQ